ncbi:hypothetical protein CYMTET_10366 [Cymbomonas tetramitiformis]|uniref:Uncharacterized protein n=1 Tax=Cymbomonas tetramitiformis TaxID=36881 RepID=A0AAE0LDX7_9CHLO|nr:hypothetical protein CYMTET_10366 [Cymbomonas tetramitiformis]|eukprot:gene15134-17900_t
MVDMVADKTDSLQDERWCVLALVALFLPRDDLEGGTWSALCLRQVADCYKLRDCHKAAVKPLLGLQESSTLEGTSASRTNLGPISSILAAGVRQAVRVLLLRDVFGWLTLSRCYDARARTVLRRIAFVLEVPWRELAILEKEMGLVLHHRSVDPTTNRVPGSSHVSTLLSSFTSLDISLAPKLAAAMYHDSVNVSHMLPLFGIGDERVWGNWGTSDALSSAVCPLRDALFGSDGRGLSLYGTDSWNSERSGEFKFDAQPGGHCGMSVNVCIGGFLRDAADFHRPWGVPIPKAHLSFEERLQRFFRARGDHRRAKAVQQELNSFRQQCAVTAAMKVTGICSPIPSKNMGFISSRGVTARPADARHKSRTWPKLFSFQDQPSQGQEPSFYDLGRKLTPLEQGWFRARVCVECGVPDIEPDPFVQAGARQALHDEEPISAMGDINRVLARRATFLRSSPFAGVATGTELGSPGEASDVRTEKEAERRDSKDVFLSVKSSDGTESSGRAAPVCVEASGATPAAGKTAVANALSAAEEHRGTNMAARQASAEDLAGLLVNASTGCSGDVFHSGIEKARSQRLRQWLKMQQFQVSDTALDSAPPGEEVWVNLHQEDVVVPTDGGRVWWWQQRHANSGDHYILRWQTELLQELGTLLNMLASEVDEIAAYSVTQFVLRPLRCRPGTIPTPLMRAAMIIDPTWMKVAEHADIAGCQLAETLLMRRHGNRPVTLVGYSFGARVIFVCLCRLARFHQQWLERTVHRRRRMEHEGTLVVEATDAMVDLDGYECYLKVTFHGERSIQAERNDSPQSHAVPAAPCCGGIISWADCKEAALSFLAFMPVEPGPARGAGRQEEKLELVVELWKRDSFMGFPTDEIVGSGKVDVRGAMAHANKRQVLKLDLTRKISEGKMASWISSQAVAAVVSLKVAFYVNSCSGAAGIVENAVLMGAPLSCMDTSQWQAAARMVSGRMINAYSSKDWILAMMYWHNEWGSNVAGLGPVGHSEVENVDLSSDIDATTDYARRLPEVIQKLNLYPDAT